MSRIIVIGGHGRTGILIVEKLIAEGNSVVATIRNPKHMADLVKRGVETVVLDLEKSPLAVFTNAMKGADAVVFAAGSGEGESSAIDRKGVVRTLHAAKNAGVKRYVAISAIGASTGMSTRSLDDGMKDYYKQKRAAGKHITTSDRDWTILEPGWLTDGKGTGKVTLSEDALEEEPITRDDVAATIIAILAEPKSAGHVLQLINGETAIRKAVETASR